MFNPNRSCNHGLDTDGIGEDFAYPKALFECLHRSPTQVDVEVVEASKSWLPILVLVGYTGWNLTYITRQTNDSSALPRGER